MKRFLIFLRVFIFWTVLGCLVKPVFLLVHASLYSGTGLKDWLSVMGYGLRLDLTMSGYLTILFALVLMLSVWFRRARVLDAMWNGLTVVSSFAFGLSHMANTVLYGYWGFPLDTMPLFYFMTSPADAMASTPLWMNLLGLLLLIVLTAVVSWLFITLTGFRSLSRSSHFPVSQTLVLLISTASLILPIRGGLSVATNNTGSVYFSERMELNHAAVNPMFSFLESALQSNEYDKQYRFMEADEAERLFKTMACTTQREPSAIDSTYFDIPTKEEGGCNVVVVVLESFSHYLTKSGGCEKTIVPRLDALEREGISFSRFYANSFRTDRGLVSIFSGFPSQPTMSLMKIAAKTVNLYSIAASLRSEGYETQYYYGGDANFTKMRSYLMQTGFERVYSEDDFDRSLRTSKWGVPDGPVFDLLLSDIRKYETSKDAKNKKPFLKVIQTSSSHEPFEVPYESSLIFPYENAFAYVDHCMGNFVDELRKTSLWDKTLVVLIPDHVGSLPYLNNYDPKRYHIPFVLTGGVVRQPHCFDVVGSQIDIPATLLSLLHIDHSDFTYSKDLFDPMAPHFAYFSFSDAMGLISADNECYVWDNTQQKMVVGKDPSSPLLRQQKAYLQTVYDDIAQMGE